jgi:hypothetical protein
MKAWAFPVLAGRGRLIVARIFAAEDDLSRRRRVGDLHQHVRMTRLVRARRRQCRHPPRPGRLSRAPVTTIITKR